MKTMIVPEDEKFLRQFKCRAVNRTRKEREMLGEPLPRETEDGLMPDNEAVAKTKAIGEEIEKAFINAEKKARGS